MTYFDDYDDTFDGDDFGDDGEDFMDHDSVEDSPDDDMGIEDEPAGDDMCEDEFTANEALMFGVAMGFAYEEGLEEAERRKLQREFDKENDEKQFDD